VADLYDYRKARVTPLDWPAYKWTSIPELVEAQQAALDGKDAPGVDSAQVPDNLRKYAKERTTSRMGRSRSSTAELRPRTTTA
jgi:hypothetical protein